MPGRSERRPGELAFAAVLLVFSILALFQAYKISGFSEISGAGVFPMLAAATMIVSGLAIFRSTYSKPAVRTTASRTVVRFFEAIAPLRFVIVVLMIIAYVAAMPSAGFVVSSGGFLFVMFAYLWRRSWLLSFGLAIVSLVLIYVVFRLGFQVVLPQGTLWR